MKKILIYGFGNPGRRDDGLGIFLTEQLEKWAHDKEFNSLCFDTNYQLNIEDAYELREFDLVLFADASKEDLDDFTISKVVSSPMVDFTTHSVSPAYLKHLAEELFGYSAQVYLLHIKGYEWQMEEGLSEKAKENYHKAFLFMQNLLRGLMTPNEVILKEPVYIKNSVP